MAAKKKKAKKKTKIPLADMLTAIDHNDFDFYSRLDKDQKKEFSPWMVMRYASSSRDYPEHYLLMVNDIVNTDFNVLNGHADKPESQHPELQWKLLAVCGNGKRTQAWKNRISSHPWIPPGNQHSKLYKFLLKLNPNLNSLEIKLLLIMNDKDDIIELAKNNGYSDKEIKELFK